MLLMQKLVLVASTGATAVLYLLLALSVFSVGVVIERWWYFRRRKLDLAELGDAVEKSLRARDIEGARKVLKASRSVEAEVIGDALAYYADGSESLQEIVQKGIRQRRKTFESGLLFLGTLGSNSPFVGLFGTVLGVVAAFKELGAASANVAATGGGMGNVMGGIAEALIATAVGILVAIPAVIAYNIFQKRCNDIEENTGALSNQVMAVMKAKSAQVVGNNKGAGKRTPMDDMEDAKPLRPVEVNS
jgi:biopolymer transport protein ExbB/TolQ